MTKQLDWKAEVATWRASGLTAREFCAGRGYPVARLYWWSSQFKRANRGVVQRSSVALARVVRKEAAPALAPVVVQIGRARIEVSAGADREALVAALEAVAAMSWGGRS